MKLESGWRYGSPGPIAPRAVNAFSDLITKIASQGNRWGTFEHFKRSFAGVSGRPYSTSSSESWAESDLNDFMSSASINAPLFIDAFYEGCQSLGGDGSIDLPDAGVINRVLHEHKVGYELRPPNLVAVGNHEAVSVPAESENSLDEEGQRLVRHSLDEANRLLGEQRYRPAVQELLWLLETISTAFAGMGEGERTIEGKYFNEIARSMKKRERGSVFEQVLNWMTTLHGYLSSPTGGGVRHGRDLKQGIELGANDAFLMANLIRSYVTYLVAEHHRLSLEGRPD